MSIEDPHKDQAGRRHDSQLDEPDPPQNLPPVAQNRFINPETGEPREHQGESGLTSWPPQSTEEE